jgi:hypothetical protein
MTTEKLKAATAGHHARDTAHVYRDGIEFAPFPWSAIAARAAPATVSAAAALARRCRRLRC